MQKKKKGYYGAHESLTGDQNKKDRILEAEIDFCWLDYYKKLNPKTGLVIWAINLILLFDISIVSSKKEKNIQPTTHLAMLWGGKPWQVGVFLCDNQNCKIDNTYDICCMEIIH